MIITDNDVIAKILFWVLVVCVCGLVYGIITLIIGFKEQDIVNKVCAMPMPSYSYSDLNNIYCDNRDTYVRRCRRKVATNSRKIR